MRRGFTLIELLVSIAIIGMLASIVIANVSASRQRSRDTADIAQLRQIQTQLDLYFDQNGAYPNSDNDGNGGWDIGNLTYTFMPNLTGFNAPRYYKYTDFNNGFGYYRYAAGSNGCPVAWGAFYVIGIRDSSRSALTSSPGFGPAEGCSRNWGAEFIWVTGKFENR